jgi:hypothetical protein
MIDATTQADAPASGKIPGRYTVRTTTPNGTITETQHGPDVLSEIEHLEFTKPGYAFEIVETR